MSNTVTNVIQPFFEELTFDHETLKCSEEINVKEEKVHEFDFDPIAFTLAATKHNKYLTEIHSLLTLDRDNFIFVADKADYESILEDVPLFQSEATKIQQYFKNKILLRRLKNYHISRYMTVMEEVLANPRVLKASHIPAMLKLADFYREDTETDAILKNHVSLTGEPRRLKLDDVFEFAGSVQKFNKKLYQVRYYFANKERNLVSFIVNGKDNNAALTYKLLNYVIQQKKPLRISATCEANYNLWQEEFLMYKNGDFTFDEPDS
jgi:hypothetical protein